MANVSNWQTMSPTAKKKLGGILDWNRKTAHPHAKCTRALMKKGVPKARAVKICAVAKDAAMKSTKWRNRSK
jgi:hypothetical protein